MKDNSKFPLSGRQNYYNIGNMNMKDVIISIVGTHQDPSGETESVELVTDGQYEFGDGQVRFSYEESELTGLGKTRTTITVDPVSVILHREGELNTEMIFQQGKKHYALYRTPFGDATLGIDNSSIHSTLAEHGGGLEIDYRIGLDSFHAQRSGFKIQVKESNHV